jgi:hypothetical protein
MSSNNIFAKQPTEASLGNPRAAHGFVEAHLPPKSTMVFPWQSWMIFVDLLGI